MSESKQYLGDSIYADTDGSGMLLTTENGLPTDPSNSIYIEVPVLVSLIKYAVRLNMIREEDIK